MKSILYDLYLGKLSPFEQIVPDNEYRQMCAGISKEIEEWRNTLSDEDYKRFIDISEKQTEANCLLCYQNFNHGIKLGMLLMIEVFMEKE